MKIHIVDYIFSASAGTVTFTDYTSISLNSILLIVDVTQNVIIYNFGQAGYGGTVSGNVLTLAYNTNSLSNNDSLLIYYDDNRVAATDTTAQAIADGIGLLKRIAEYTSVLDTTDSNQRLRVNVDAAGTSVSAAGLVIATLPTLATVTAVTAITDTVALSNTAAANGPGAIITNGTTSANATQWTIPDVWHNIDQSRLSYAHSIRQNLTFS